MVNAMAKERKGKSKKKRVANHVWQDAFISEFSKCGVVGRACESSGVGIKAVWERRKTSAEFSSRYEEAKKKAGDVLKEEARRRAVDGLLRKKFGKGGEPIIDPETGKQYCEREYSDTLLIFLLKGAFPEEFRENVRQQVEVTGHNGGPIQLKAMTDDDIRSRAEAILAASRLEGKLLAGVSEAPAAGEILSRNGHG